MSQNGTGKQRRARRVYGESAAAIMSALNAAELSPEPSEGVRRLRVEASPSAVTPLIRAVLRAEAELLLDEADMFEVGVKLPTGDELQAMAVFAVARAAAEATGGELPGP